MAADFVVSLEARPVGAVRGTRDLAQATKELTQETGRSGDASRRAATAAGELERAERRRISAAAEMVRSVKTQIAALAEYQKQMLAAANAEAARSAATVRNQTRAVVATGVDPSSRLGGALTALLEKERQLRASIQETAQELVRSERVAANVTGLQARTRAMEGALAAARRGEEAERAYAAALEVRRQVEASGARPGTDQSAAVEREVRAQQRLEEELRAVAAARERDRRAAEAANAQRDRVAGEIARLRETTHQLEIQATAYLRGRNAVREANIQLEIRNTLLRQGVAAGSADATIIEQQIRRQAQLRQQIDQTTGAKRRLTEGAFTLRNAFFALQGAIAALGLSALIRDSVNVALSMDRATKSFVAATGSQTGAAREMAFVREEANRLGLVLTNTSQGYSSLANAAKGTVLEGQAARDIFSAVAEASTVLGLSADQMSGALLGVQQTISKGKVTAEELVQQISERLPGAYQAMATSLGISTAELSKRLEQGKVGLQDLVGWAEEMRKRFSAGLLTAVNSDQANINRLTNLINDVKASIGRGFLEGFLAGFEDLREELSGDELRLAAKNLGEEIGKALRIAADAAAWLAKNLELVKAAIIAILALRAAGAIVNIATALAEAAGRAIVLKTALSSVGLAGALTGIGVVLLGVIVVMQRYIAEQQLAFQQEQERVRKSRELFNYYDQLRGKKEGLTEAEKAYALEVRKTLEAERARLAIEVASARRKVESTTPSNPLAFWAKGANRTARDELAALEREAQTVSNELNILSQQWERLEALPAPKLEDPELPLDQTAQKIRDILDSFQRAASQATRMAVANRESAAEALRVSESIEREEAAYQALNSIEGLSAASKARLGAIIEKLVGVTQEANRASEEAIAITQRDLEYTNAAREAEARLEDARNGGIAATRDLTAALQAEAFARELGREEDAAYIAQLKAANLVRNDYLRSIDQEVAAIERKRQSDISQRQLLAELADARNQDSVASRRLAVELEAENTARNDGISLLSLEFLILKSAIFARERDADATRAQTNAQIALNAARAAEDQERAEFSDWQAQTAFAHRYGDALAGIFQQYGLLSEAVEEVRIQEEIRQRVVADGLDADRAAIEADVRAQHARIQAIREAWAAAEIQVWVAEPFLEGMNTVEGDFFDTLNGMLLHGQDGWKQFWERFLQQALEAIEQWLLRWITAHRLAQAEAARTAAVNAAAGSSVAAGGGGVTGNLTTIGMTGASTAAAGGSSALGTSFSAWGTYAAYGFLAWVGFKIYEGWTKARVSFGEASFSGATGGSRKIADEMAAVIRQLVKEIEDLAKQWNLGVVSLENSAITIGRTSRGMYYVKGEFLGNIGQAFRTIEEALDFARVAALRTAEFAATTSRLVVEIIRNTRAQTTQQLQEEIEIGRRIDSFAPDQTAQAIRNWEEELDGLRARIIELIPRSAELATALANISAEEVRRWQALRDQITGRQRTEAEEVADRQARARQFNAEKALRIASLRLDAIELQMRIDHLRARGEIVRVGGGLARNDINAGYDYVVAKGTLLKAEVSLYQQHLSALEAQLAAINQVIDGLIAIPDINPDDIKVPRTRGGGRGADDRDSLMDQVIAARRQRELAQMSEFARQQAEINQRWDEAIRGQGLQANALDKARRAHEAAIKAANGNAEAIRKADEAFQRATRRIRQSQEAIDAANKEREEELRLLREGAIADLYGRLRGYEEGAAGTGSGPLSGLAAIRREAEAMRVAFNKEAAELHFGAERIARGLARISAAERARVAALTEQVIDGLGLPMEALQDRVNLLGETIGFLRDRMADGTISAERFGGIFAQMQRQAESELLGLAQGILENMGQTQEAAAVKAALEEANFDIQVAQLNFLFQQYQALGLLSDAAADRIQRALDIINNPANRPSFGPPPPPADTRRFLGYDDAPTTSGGASNPQNTLLDAARRFANAVDSYVRATEELLVDPELSILSSEEQVARLREDFYETLAAARGGDAEAAERLGSIQRQLLEAQIRFTGGGADAQGNAAYIALFQELMAAGQTLVNSPVAQQSFDLAATVQAQGDRTHRDLETLISIMQDIRDSTGGQVYFAPEAFAPDARPRRGDLDFLDRTAAGPGFTPQRDGGGQAGDIVTARELRALRDDLRDYEAKRERRENRLGAAAEKTASNTTGWEYGKTRNRSRGFFRTGA